MADVRPLAGVRFNRALTGPVGPLLAPPYDVIAGVADRHEPGIGSIENVDLGVAGNQHVHAARRYRAWREAGVLQRDPAPAIYIHQHQFESDGASLLRTGVLARVRLADWAERIVLPHERTTPGPKAERLERLRIVGANLSPLYFLYRDPTGDIRDLVTRHAFDDVVLAGEDRIGAGHRLSRVSDPTVHERLAQVFAQRSLFVADGHHRYEAALAFRNELRRRHGYDPDAPWEFVLVLLAAVEDPGVVVRPTHRLLIGAGTGSPAALLNPLRRWFALGPAEGPLAAVIDDHFISRLVLPNSDGRWDIHALPGNPHYRLLPNDRGGSWRSLPVAAVEGIVESAYGMLRGRPDLVPVVDQAEAERQVAHGMAQAAFLLPAPRLDQVLRVAEEGDLLPAKSTWFDPKAPAGLVINELRG